MTRRWLSSKVTLEAADFSGPLMRAALRLVAGPEISRWTGTCWPRTVALPSHVPVIGVLFWAKTAVESRRIPARSFMVLDPLDVRGGMDVRRDPLS